MSTVLGEADIGPGQTLSETDNEPVSPVQSSKPDKQSKRDEGFSGSDQESQGPVLNEVNGWEGEEEESKPVDRFAQLYENLKDEDGSIIETNGVSVAPHAYEKLLSADGSLSTPDEALSVQVGHDTVLYQYG